MFKIVIKNWLMLRLKDYKNDLNQLELRISPLEENIDGVESSEK
jgi:hypothetical protein